MRYRNRDEAKETYARAERAVTDITQGMSALEF